MKTMRILTAVLFSLLILIPLVTFNWEPDAVSEIDNRKLASSPFSGEGDLTENIEDYVSDRIGLRDEMILSYTLLNDRLFGKMVHPSYSYGEDGYVFGAGLSRVQYSDFHDTFADMVKAIQNYCEARDVPFLFVFNPAKPAVLTEYLADGINYDRSWVDKFFAALDERGVRYLDNTTVLREKTEEGIAVFNQKYDANHWNDWGAYYGTNAILSAMKQLLPSVYVNTLEDLVVSEKIETSLKVSNFPINEAVPAISLTTAFENQSYKCAELDFHPSFTSYGYYVNPTRQAEGAPKALVFQGSYMNEYGYKYLINGFGEYIRIHDYQNVLNFPYYYNIFQPDCVIFEVAEYTFENTYFDYETMKALSFNPPLSTVKEEATAESSVLDPETITVERGDFLTKIRWETADTADFVWLTMETEYDMAAVDGGYEVTVETAAYDQSKDLLSIVTWAGGTLRTFS